MEIFYKVKLKKIKLEEDTERKYRDEYQLTDVRDKKKVIPRYYKNIMIDDKEKVLFAIFYRYSYDGPFFDRDNNKDWDDKDYIIYVVEHNDEIIVKYLKINDEKIKLLEKEKMMSDFRFFRGIPNGLIFKEYKDYIKNEVMEIIKIDKGEFEEKTNVLSKIEYDISEYFTCTIEFEKVDYFDYINDINFYCDKYYLEKYKPCIEFINYILKKCNVFKKGEISLKSFNKEEKQNIMIELIKRKIKYDGGYFV